jgi:hypothetical protein
MKRITFLFLAYIPLLIYAQENRTFTKSDSVKLEKGINYSGLYFDNDWVINNFGLENLNLDKNYTQGTAFCTSFQNKYFVLNLPHLLLTKLIPKSFSEVGNAYDFDSEGLHNSYIELPSRFMIGTSAFTPDSLRAVDPILDDRPYGSFVYLNTKMQKLNYKKHHLYSSDFYIGALGLGLTKVVQTWIHTNIFHGNDTIDPVKPKGWHNQISNGGELSFLWNLSLERLITGKKLNKLNKNKWKLELKDETNLYIGYLTGISYGMNFRLGYINPYNWITNNTPISVNTKVNDVVDNVVYNYLGLNDGFKSEYFLYGGLKPNFILYNALLSGQFKESAHTVSSKPFILEWSLGLGFNIKFPSDCLCKGVNFGLGLAGRTGEFYGNFSKTHNYGSINMTVKY